MDDLDPDMMRRAILDMRSRARLCIAKNGGPRTEVVWNREIMEFNEKHANVWPVIKFSGCI